MAKPLINPNIQESLTSLGGLVPSGKYANEPRIKIVYGPEVTEFLKGKERPRFTVLGSGKHIYKRWFVSDKLFAELADWILKVDPLHTNPATPIRFSEFFKTANSLEFKELEESENPHSDLIAPEGWHYITDMDEYRESVIEAYFVLQYVSPEQIPDTEATWNATRWDVSYVPEQEREVLVDAQGPFPKDGLYLNELLALYKTDEQGNIQYIEPTFENTVEPVKKMIHERDKMSAWNRKIENRKKKFFEENLARQQQQKQKDWQEYDLIAEDARPAFDSASAWVGFGNVKPKK